MVRGAASNQEGIENLEGRQLSKTSTDQRVVAPIGLHRSYQAIKRAPSGQEGAFKSKGIKAPPRVKWMVAE